MYIYIILGILILGTIVAFFYFKNKKEKNVKEEKEIFPSIPEEQESDFVFKHINPLMKVDRTQNVDDFPLVFDVVKGEYLTLQFLIKSRKDCKVEIDSVDDVKIYVQNYIKSDRAYHSPSKDKLVFKDDLYPDILVETDEVEVKAGINKVITIDIPVNNLTEIPVVVVVDGETAYSWDVILNIHDVGDISKTIPYSNWYHEFDYKMISDVPVENFSEEYWRMFENIVKVAKEIGQTMFTINPLFLLQFKANGSTDFTNFDRAVEICLKYMEGVICRQFAIRSTGDFNSEYVMMVPKFWHMDNFVIENLPLDQARAFYDRFLVDYTAHIITKNWGDVILQHIADEPQIANGESYRKIANYCRTFLKSGKIRTIEAVSDASLTDCIDILVFQLGELSFRYEEVMNKLRQSGKEGWIYVANHPQGEFPNRYIEQPLIKARLLPWVAFRYNLKGFLHWGMNFWGESPYTNASVSSFKDQTIEFPGGDSSIVYPAFERVIPSMRALEIRNGLNDVAILEKLNKKDPQMANQIAQEVFNDFTNYNTNVNVFLRKKKEILQRLK